MKYFNRSRFASVPIPRYKCLTIEKLTQMERDKISAQVVLLLTGPQAERFATGDNGWSYEKIDLMGRVGLLKHRGIEVSLFFNRQITEWEQGQFEPCPEGVLTIPEDSWMRLDLLGPSARQTRAVVANQKRHLEEQIRMLEQQLKAKELLLGSQDVDLRFFKEKKNEFEAKVEELKGFLSTAKKKESLLRTEAMEQVVVEVFHLTESINKAKDTHKEDSLLWTMLLRMAEEVIRKFGGGLITPNMGDLFNPQTQEAISVISGGNPNMVLKIHNRGLKMNGKLVIPARVDVGGV